VSTSLNVEAWDELLPLEYPNRAQLLENIRSGFQITNLPQPQDASVEVHNYKSATNARARPHVERQIQEELDNNNYRIVFDKPHIVSALGAIPKDKAETKFRLIHDASRPAGQALNDLAVNSPFKYQTVNDAVRRIKPNSWLGKVDLSNAYRSVGIHPDDYSVTGLKWRFSGQAHDTYMIDQRLCFGARRSPEIFNALSHAVLAIMKSRGAQNLVYYMDDWLCINEDKELCRAQMADLIMILRKLGFQINYNKVEGPAQSLKFLGIQLNTVAMTLSLSQDKINELKSCIELLKAKLKVSRKELESLVGKLNWASQVIYGGRFFMRRLYDRLNTLRKACHRTRVTRDMRADMEWWLKYLDVWNGTQPMVEQRPGISLATDACNKAAGAYFHGHWIYTPWREAWPQAADLHINHKEVLALEPALAAWAPLLANQRVYVHCDNTCAVATINKGVSKHPIVMQSLRRIFWLSAVFNFRITARYYGGSSNRIADAVSRLHENNGYYNLLNAVYGPGHAPSAECYSPQPPLSAPWSTPWTVH
jgi:hypothetical protein